jgi:hypothetical protein
MKYLCLLLAAVALTGCQIKEKYAANDRAADGWVAQRTAAPKINVTGKWKSDAWGKGEFKQKGREVTGTLGDYKIKGVVSGYRAYLVADQDDWSFYTIVLKRHTADALEGSYSSSVPYSALDEQDIYLRRDLGVKK